MHPDTATPDCAPFMASRWDFVATQSLVQTAPVDNSETIVSVPAFDIETLAFRFVLVLLALGAIAWGSILPAIVHGPAVIPATLPVVGLILALIAAVWARDARS